MRRSRVFGGTFVATASCLVLCIALGAVIARAPTLAFATLALSALIAALLLRPMMLWAAALALLVLVPYYALPNVGGEPLVPAALIGWVLGLRLFFERGRAVKFVAL